MGDRRFDAWTKALRQSQSNRRAAFLGLASAMFGALAIRFPGDAEAKKRRKKRKKKRKKKNKVKFNEFGCVNVGNFCQNAEQCCSGICEGAKCQAHNSADCVAGQQQAVCGGTDVECTDPEDGIVCNTTTGNAGYCAGEGSCFACTRDTDCIELCGAGAACIRCAAECEETGGTACFGLGLCEGG